ncbi:ATP-dependent DNA helicase MPH1 [Scaptodrosophila lebanonensis]|uniref:ATP-dependent DNA helicase MPH1 n=1 Tax=Drosophila lebanonensis TaxID=7225 RepID=A0A6J2U6K8_DROLE|nr:ATP-dependent DNA helicase MPH1 [Scaptodrosophila lebanonensis]
MSNDNAWPADDDLDLALALNDNAALQELLDRPHQQAQKPQQQQEQQYAGFDETAGDTWIYPSNLPMRCYQHNISQAALFRNTLVVLPTGLGKTFIAAVVMYNLYRWYPRGKIIFMAPTRPLVSQQINACQKIMPLPPEDTVELTGKLPRAKRAELWANKRVFFATPQVVQSDMLDSGENDVQFPFGAIKLLVVDEAHRAKGRYAYTQVAESIFARNPYFRVLALSATPGRTIDDVAAVCRNLFISHLEVRSDNSIDVVQYVHQRSFRTIIVPLSEQLKELRQRMIQIIDPYLRQLVASDVLSGSHSNFNRNFLLFEQKRFQERAANGQRHPEHSLIAGTFSMCISLYHALELLEKHGLRVFVNSFDADEDGRDKFVLVRDAGLRELVDAQRQQLGPNPFDVSTATMTNGQMAPMPSQLDFGHPKYERARQVLLEYFQTNAESRAIVFCEYRESVMLIQRLLLQHTPLLRPRCFVGQGGTTGAIRALTQKQQMQIMNDFRSGTSNVLVATSIGEEGIDVGEVELIVCFDICTSNPTRFVQRIGRTGRQKRGHVVMLATEGREEQVLKEVLATRDKTNRKLLQSPLVKRALYDHCPRLVPTEFNPKCVQKFMEPQKQADATPPKSKAKEAKSKEPKTRKVNKKATNVKNHDLRKFFVRTEPPLLDTQERLVFEQEGETPPQPYVMSEASQQQIRADCARRSAGKIKNFLLDTQAAEPSSPPPPAITSSSQQEAQRLRKLNRLLQSSKPLLNESQRSQSLATQLQDKVLPLSLKKMLLRHNRRYVQEVCEKMRLQQELNLPNERLNSRQRSTRRQHEQLLDICGDGVDNLADLQRSPSPKANLRKQELAELQHIGENADLEGILNDIFEGLDEQGLCADNCELVQQQLNVMERTVRQQQDEPQSRVYDGGTFSFEELEEGLGEETLQEGVDNSMSRSHWQEFKTDAAQHKSTPLKADVSHSRIKVNNKLDTLEEEEEQTTRVEASELSINLTRLNNILSVATSTPLGVKTKPVQETLLNALETDLSTFEQLALQVEAKTAAQKTNNNNNSPSKIIPDHKLMGTAEKTPDCLDVLDLDLDDFLEPLPEEQMLQEQRTLREPTPSPSTSLKENCNLHSNQLLLSPAQRNCSPDLFAEESMSPWKPASPKRPVPSKSLAAKLAEKTSKVPSRQPRPTTPSSPEQRERPKLGGTDKSPSIFDLYLKRMRGRGHLGKAAKAVHLSSSSIAKAQEVAPPNKEQDDSPIIARRQPKRKIIASDSDEEVAETEPISLADNSSDMEQVPATQMQETPPVPRKRRKFNSFIINEAEMSGSDHDEEAEHTIGGYIKDSVIVSSEDDDDGHNDTTSHAMYLQALRSPVRRPGAFKIPARRVYNDESHIYSQQRELEPSQYIPSSFIVDEAETDISARETRDVSECPLERAERILKEERRQKRRLKRFGSPQPRPQQSKRRRVQPMANSSSDDDDIGFVR